MKRPKAKDKGGRPPKRKGERLSKNRTFRVRGKLDERLIAAAAETGRSVSEEIEHRLEMSFQEEDWFEHMSHEVENAPPEDFPQHPEELARADTIKALELSRSLLDEVRKIYERGAEKWPDDGEKK